MTIKNYFCIIMISDEFAVVRNYVHIKVKRRKFNQTCRKHTEFLNIVYEHGIYRVKHPLIS